MVTLDDFAATADAIAATGSKREKVGLLADFLRGCEEDDLVRSTRYFGGVVFAVGDPRTLNAGGAVFGAVLRDLAGADDAAIASAWRQFADSGDVTRALLQGRTPDGPSLMLADVDAGLSAVSAASGTRAKASALRALLTRATAGGARYVAKLISGDMRIGLREGLVEEAIGVAFDAEARAVSRALMVVGDLGEVARRAAEQRLDDARPQWFVPMRFMLATPVSDAGEAVARMGADVWVEDKYDGIRCQLHRRGDRVALYSRDLKDVTRQFPEVTVAALQLPSDALLDGEVLAYDSGRVQPFQA
ncbi:MAG: DNA ligase, partial [Candidatus Dormibacteria bacterium]